MTAIFNFNGTDLRTIEIEGEPWFVAADVCRILGLSTDKGTTNHLRNLCADERKAVTPTQVQGLRGAGATVISESGLYKLIMRSDKATARPFQDWVTKDVLPAIRRTGGYLLNENARETAHADTREAPPIPAEFMAVFQKQSEQIDRLLSLVEQLALRPAAAPSVPGEAPAEQEQGEVVLFPNAFHTAREVAMKLKLAGALPTKRELQTAAIQTGQQLSALCRLMKRRPRVVERHGYPTSAYPKDVIEAFANGVR